MEIHSMYEQAVQDPENESKLISKTYSYIRKKKAHSLREDFCGTAALSLSWLNQDHNNKTICVDIDNKPFEWSKTKRNNILSQINNRLTFRKANVLEKDRDQTQIIAALNFSYFIFHDRNTLKNYFKKSYDSLTNDGILVMDHFGGSDCLEPSNEWRRCKGFTYYWEQEEFDPVNNRSVFNIHFKPKGLKKINKAFSYDWRLWSIPELRDLLFEVGFSDVKIFFETDDEDEDGNPIYKEAKSWESMACWIAYVVGVK